MTKESCCYLFSNLLVLIKGSNEEEVVAIIEVLRIYSGSFHERSWRVIFYCHNLDFVETIFPWKFYFLLNEIRSLTSSIQVVLEHINHLANILANSFAKYSALRDSPFVGSWYRHLLMVFFLVGACSRHNASIPRLVACFLLSL